MDSLDELLADLHSATSTMKTEQRLSNSTRSSGSSGSLPSQAYQSKITAYRPPSGGSDRNGGGINKTMHYGGAYQPRLTASGGLGSGDRLNAPQFRRDSDRYSAGSSGSGDIAPPLPPPPSQEVIEESNMAYSGGEPLYEPQNIVMAKVNNHISPRQPPQNPAVRVSPRQHTIQTQAAPTHPPTHPAVTTSGSNLGANLNELDYLLQDLNSAQFMRDISRSGSDASVNSQPTQTVRAPPPATMPKPTKNTSSPKSPGVTFNTSIDTPSGGLSTPGYASSATRELDELMDSLSQFKMNPNMAPSPSPVAPQATPSPRSTNTSQSRDSTDDPSYAKVDKTPSNPSSPGVSPAAPTPKPNSELDSMLGNLESDMIGHGVSVSTKGLCGACAKPIAGQVITALGKIWHLEHFCCQSCREELGTRSFFERDEMPYCEICYHRLFAPTCEKCQEPILDKCVTAMDTTWHMECFVCDHCGRMLNDEGFHERDGRPYCRDDYYEIFAPKCGGCRLPIIDDFISTLNTHWHTACFRCMDCGCTLAGGSFFDHDGYPYCETHYYAKRGSLCAGCQKPITGRCITAMSQKFHPEHFTCAFCLKQLNKGTFKEQNDKPYCHPCFVKLFG